MTDSTRHRYETAAVVVTWDAGVCIHAAECVRGLPAVFDPKATPWVRPAAASPAALAAVIARCPSGALRLARNDDAGVAAASGPLVIAITPDGPYVCAGAVAIDGSRREPPVALCRCGRSAHKPYCDGSHADAGFRDPGRLPADAGADAYPTTAVALALTVRPNGPLKFDGALTLAGSDGRSATAGQTFLCRCGQSRRKPYCDGTHKAIGFVA